MKNITISLWLVSALVMADSNLIPDISPKQLEPIKKRMNDDRIAVLLNNDFTILTGAIIEAGDYALSRKISGLAKNASKLAGNEISKYITEQGVENIMSKIPKDVSSALKAVTGGLNDIWRAEGQQLESILTKTNNC